MLFAIRGCEQLVIYRIAEYAACIIHCVFHWTCRRVYLVFELRILKPKTKKNYEWRNSLYKNLAAVSRCMWTAQRAHNTWHVHPHSIKAGRLYTLTNGNVKHEVKIRRLWWNEMMLFFPSADKERKGFSFTAWFRRVISSFFFYFCGISFRAATTRILHYHIDTTRSCWFLSYALNESGRESHRRSFRWYTEPAYRPTGT